MTNLERKIDEIDGLFHIFEEGELEIINREVYGKLKLYVEDKISFEESDAHLVDESLLIKVRLCMMEKNNELLNGELDTADIASFNACLILKLNKLYPEDAAVECIDIISSNSILQNEKSTILNRLQDKATENLGSESIFDTIVESENLIRDILARHGNQKREENEKIFSKNSCEISLDVKDETDASKLNVQINSSSSFVINDPKAFLNLCPSKSAPLPEERLHYAVVHIDHMNDSRNYFKLLKKWANKLSLNVRILYRNPDHNKVKNRSGGSRVENIYLLLSGNCAEGIKSFLSQLRTEFVDIDAKGKKCKERNAKLLGQRSSSVPPMDESKTSVITSSKTGNNHFIGFVGFEIETPYNDENELESKLDSYKLLHFGVGKERFN